MNRLLVTGFLTLVLLLCGGSFSVEACNMVCCPNCDPSMNCMPEGGLAVLPLTAPSVMPDVVGTLPAEGKISPAADAPSSILPANPRPSDLPLFLKLRVLLI